MGLGLAKRISRARTERTQQKIPVGGIAQEKYGLQGIVGIVDEDGALPRVESITGGTRIVLRFILPYILACVLMGITFSGLIYRTEDAA